jgi:nitrogen fixation NifU-like protein
MARLKPCPFKAEKVSGRAGFQAAVNAGILFRAGFSRRQSFAIEEITMAYSDKVLDHYSNPRNVGSLDKNSTEVGTGLVGAPECGDVMKLQIKVNPTTNIIEDAKFKTFGCGSAIASSSLATEWVKGKTVDEALTIRNTDIVKELSLPPVKIHCSVLAEDAIRAAIGDWKKKNGQTSQAQPVPVEQRA